MLLLLMALPDLTSRAKATLRHQPTPASPRGHSIHTGHAFIGDANYMYF
jgi:hypothetical protein